MLKNGWLKLVICILALVIVFLTTLLYLPSRFSSVQFFFDREAYKPLTELLDGAKKEILVQMYSFTHDDLIRKLEKAKARGVDVRVIADDRDGNEDLLNVKFAVKWEMSDKMFHRKLAVVDRQWIWLGSTNWTYSGFEKNSEVDILISSPDEAQKIIKQFEQDWRQCKERK